MQSTANYNSTKLLQVGIGMCWSGYLSTHTAMLDAIGYRELTSKAIVAHTIGGVVAAMVAHWVMLLYGLI